MNNFSKASGFVTGKMIAIIAIALTALIMFISYFSIQNAGSKQEASIEGTYRNNQQVLSACAVSIRNISKIPAMYRKDFESLVKSELEARYGGQGTDRVAIFVKERSLEYSPAMYEKIQNETIACETRFSLAQSKLIELQTNFEVMLNSSFTGAVLSAQGFPRKDLSKFKIILDGGVQEQFETGTRQDYDIK